MGTCRYMHEKPCRIEIGPAYTEDELIRAVGIVESAVMGKKKETVIAQYHNEEPEPEAWNEDPWNAFETEESNVEMQDGHDNSQVEEAYMPPSPVFDDDDDDGEPEAAEQQEESDANAQQAQGETEVAEQQEESDATAQQAQGDQG